MTDTPTDATVLWVASPTGAHVVLREDIPAGDYAPEFAQLLGARLTEAAQKAAEAHGIAQWLSEAGCPPEVVSKALESWRDKSARQEFLTTLGLFTKGGLFG
jgi:hypothetical protein